MQWTEPPSTNLQPIHNELALSRVQEIVLTDLGISLLTMLPMNNLAGPCGIWFD